MKISGVVAEFNPFHNGHHYLLQEMHASCDAVVAVMSGNFVQRGGGAIFDKFSRAAAAVRGGVDLVLELPVRYATANAEQFARGAVATLDALGVVDTLCFGVEDAAVETLWRAADALADENEVFQATLKQRLTQGLSHPAARQEALCAVIGDAGAVLRSPNHTLAVEYLKAIRLLSSTMTAQAIIRQGTAHDAPEPSGRFASASHLRAQLSKERPIGRFVPFPVHGEPIFERAFEPYLCYALRTADKDALCRIDGCDGALAARLLDARSALSMEELLHGAGCRNYTDSRIRRILYRLFLQLEGGYEPPHYLRVLALNERGAQVLHDAKKAATLPIVMRGVLLKDDSLFQEEARATDLYNLARNLPCGMEYLYSPSV